jgi:hypothetical protein
MSRKPRPDLAARNSARVDPGAPSRLWVSEHNIWRGMLQRCHNPKAKDYPRYGGRGIAVCEEWRASFTAFLIDVGQRPSAAHSLDRIRNDEGYFKTNCEWRLATQQCRNRRSNTRIEFRGENLTLVEWSRRTGIGRVLIMHRLRAGWTTEDALTVAPSRSMNSRHRNRRGNKELTPCS